MDQSELPREVWVRAVLAVDFQSGHLLFCYLIDNYAIGFFCQILKVIAKIKVGRVPRLTV